MTAPGLPDSLRRIVRAARALTGAGRCVLGTTDPAALVYDPDCGDAGGDADDGEPVPDDVVVRLVAADRPLRLSDLTDLSPGDPRTAPARSLLGVPVPGADGALGGLYVVDAPGTDFTATDLDVLSALAAAAGVAVAGARTDRRERWVTASQQVTAALLDDLDQDGTLHLIAEAARQVAGGSVAGIARPYDGGRRLVFEVVAGAGDDVDQLTGLSVPPEGTATGVAFTTGEPITVRRYGEKVIAQQAGTPRALPGLLHRLDSAVAVPLTVRGSTLGVLLVARIGDATPFGAHEVGFVRAFAAQAALAVEFGRAAEQRQRLAVFEDRDRIARDLHDLVIQRLFALGLGIEGISHLSPDPAVRERLEQAVHELDRTIRDVRTSIFTLREPAEASGGVRSELLRQVLDTAPMLGFEPRTSFDGPLDSVVRGPVRADLLATVREALSNIARHAEASAATVDVALDATGRHLTLAVTDDGVGTPADRTRNSGLANLAARAARWHGELTVGAGPGGRGTALNWTADLPEEQP
ncbi:sensor histidine kinase [Actinocatenispora rupis]|uniref:Histidine kinase n=1 Tax=Actinocatenispora rupis TaxID=519421 RepID=A0A8J3JIH3_9ACTN|nr:GAF domain-containing protein [Actinocatenispora rupis]GID15588.1 histidine kinase [Actinocatenispora rupis]